jgi:copper resistance protein B
MLRSSCLGLFASCALFAATPAIAQEDPDGWTLGGGFDLLELRAGKGDEIFIWDATFSLGDATDQLMLKTSGGGALDNQIDEVDAQLLYGRTIGATTLLAGVRQDIEPHDGTYAVIGAEGTFGPHLGWETFVFLSDDGDVTGELEAVSELPITGKLNLEPRLKVGWSAQGSAAEGARSGLTEAEASVRLRYSLSEHVNVYGGVVHERLLGATRRLARQQGDELNSTMAVIGIGFSL